MFALINFLATILIASAVAYHYYMFLDTKRKHEDAILAGYDLTRNEVTQAKNESDAKVAEASKNLNAEIEKTSTTLSSQLDDTRNTITEDIGTAKASLEAKTQNIEQQVAASKNLLDSQFKTLSESIVSKSITADTINTTNDVTVGNNLKLMANQISGGADRLHIAGDQELYVLTKNGVVVGKEWGGNGNAFIQGDVTVGNNLKLTANQISGGKERLHIAGEKELYVLNKNGLIVGKEWGGNGNAFIQGDVSTGGNLNISGNIQSGDKRLTMVGDKELYVSNKGGLIVSKERGGNGNTIIEGQTNINGDLKIGGNITSDKNRLNVFGDKELYVQSKGGLVVGKDAGGNGNAIIQGEATVGGSMKIGGDAIQSGQNRFNLAGERDLYVLNKEGLVVSRDAGGSGNATIQGEANIGSHLNLYGNFNTPGRLHVAGDGEMYVLKKGGLVVGKEWGGNGNASVQGDVYVGGKLCINDVCITKDQLSRMIK